MGCLTNYWESLALNHVMLGSACPQPTDLFLALFTSDPAGAGEGAISFSGEPDGASYERQQIGVGSANWTTSTNKSSTNQNLIDFGVAGEDWSTITHYAVMDDLTLQSEANMLFHGEFSSSKTVTSGTSVRVQAGELSLTAGSAIISNYMGNGLINHLLNISAFSQSSSIQVGLSTTNPGADGGNITDPTGTPGTTLVTHTDWTTSSAGTAVANSSTITFTAAASNWGLVGHGYILNQSSNLLFYGNLASGGVTVSSGESVRFSASQLSLNFG